MIFLSINIKALDQKLVDMFSVLQNWDKLKTSAQGLFLMVIQ